MKALDYNDGSKEGSGNIHSRGVEREKKGMSEITDQIFIIAENHRLKRLLNCTLNIATIKADSEGNTEVPH